MQSFQPLAGKKIALGFTGGIACYKGVELLRKLKKLGAYVIPLMTSDAKKFIGSMTVSALADEPVVDYLFSPSDPIAHTRIGRSIDALVVAPATANIISSFATARSDNPVSLAFISTNAPVIICPSMHNEMWQNPIVRANVEKLIQNDVIVVAPQEGELAGGDFGAGRLADLDLITEIVERTIRSKKSIFKDKKVIVTAGGTREPIDPVRFLTNRSSGKQGHYLAKEAWALGADVTLITSSKLDYPKSVNRIQVETADELLNAVLKELPNAHCLFMSAAVSDFKPDHYSPVKIKRANNLNSIQLVKTPDILSEAIKRKAANQVIVGFAAETNEALLNAEKKFKEKQLDVMVVNDVSQENVGFDHETNAVEIISNELGHKSIELRSKAEVASIILEYVGEILALRGVP
jgi:phosphopantothenoylcysteine decarboxylase/phosphopantothenate--cysteine ligase